LLCLLFVFRFLALIYLEEVREEDLFEAVKCHSTLRVRKEVVLLEVFLDVLRAEELGRLQSGHYYAPKEVLLRDEASPGEVH
jgi:hypothetical protein